MAFPGHTHIYPFIDRQLSCWGRGGWLLCLLYICVCVYAFLVSYLLVYLTLEVKGFYAVTVGFPSNMYLLLLYQFTL